MDVSEVARWVNLALLLGLIALLVSSRLGRRP